MGAQVLTDAHPRPRLRDVSGVFERSSVGALIATRRNMSHKTVQLVIGWLLTDEDLRQRFTELPRQTLQTLCDQGYELTPEECEAILRCDPTFWASGAKRIDRRLRRAILH